MGNVSSGAKWVIAIVIVYTTWYLVNQRDEKAGNWLVVLLLLSAYTYNRKEVNAELVRLGVLK
jgi:hypothetical protein